MIKIPKDVEYILNQLKKNGYQAFVVGGCVRDSLLEKKPKDWDITTNALPQEVKPLFEKTIDTGIQHGTITIIVNNKGYEVTTYRIDGKYLDGRRPDEVTFTNSIIHDLARRDFTMNAMAYNEEEGLIDPFGGREDLSNQVISCVGTANDRFKEDALRMLRAVRFSAELKFEIEHTTRRAIFNHAKKILNVSIERIREEINKILLSDAPEKIELLCKLKLLPYIIDNLKTSLEIEEEYINDVYKIKADILNSLKYIEPVLHLRLAVLLSPLRDKHTKNILKKMKYDNQTIEKIENIMLYHDIQLEANKIWIKKRLNKIGIKAFEDILKIKEAKSHIQSDMDNQIMHSQLVEINNLLNQIIVQNECFQRGQLAINGKDLIELGIPKGVELGYILDHLVDSVIEYPELNNREQLLGIAKHIQRK